ncbi:MAG: FRG domain-containing protein [Caldilineaceae bacterium SB0664_bin_22]|nr:FRG domain-containing protein [Caldilineaceae bacterium SB0664_bin_22]
MSNVQNNASKLEQHSPEVLDDSHGGVREAIQSNPDGWRVTLRHIQAVSLEFAFASISANIRGEGIAYRGEPCQFHHMRSTLMRRMLRTTVIPHRQLTVHDFSNPDLLRREQAQILEMAVKRGFASPKDSPELWLNDLLPEDPVLRRLLYRLQHHGGPTFLLDWTRDMYKALYFACNKSFNHDGRLWFMAIENPPGETSLWVSSRCKGRLKELPPYFFVEPNRVDETRLRDQASLFLYLEYGWIAWNQDTSHKVRGVTIPQHHKQPLLQYLKHGHGVEHHTMFADLPGAVHWIQEGSKPIMEERGRGISVLSESSSS